MGRNGPMRPMKLRSHLLLLTLGSLLPIVVFTIVAGWMLLMGLSGSSLSIEQTLWLMGAGVFLLRAEAQPLPQQMVPAHS